MAILYYPAGSKVAQVNAWNPGYEQLYLNVNPNMVFYFDSGSVINSASASNLSITASWAQTASILNYIGITTSSTASVTLQGYYKIIINGTGSWAPYYSSP
jgi:hypothetical protein